MQKIWNLIKNSFRSLALGFRFAPFLTTILFAITIVSYVAPIYQAKLLGDIINQIILALESLSTQKTVLFLIALYAGVTAFTKILSSISAYVDKHWSLAFEHGLEILTATKRTEIDLGHYENSDFQNLMTMGLSRGIWRVSDLGFGQFLNIASIVTILLSSIITTQLGWHIYAIIVITSLPLFIIEIKFGGASWHIWSEASPRQKMFEKLRDVLFHSRTGIVQTKLLQNGSFIIGKIKAILDSFRKDQYRVDRKRLYYSIFASIFSASGFGYAFYLIAQGVYSGAILVGTMVFLVNILGQLVGAISQLLTQVARQFEQNLYVDDYFKIMDTKPYIKVSENPISLPKTVPVIEFKNVWFKYDGTEKWILENINFKILPGEKIALVGENGAGKSTLIKLLARIYDPNEGEILINGINLKNLDPKEWISHLAILLQDYIGYDLTVSESIALGRVGKEVDQESIEEASRLGGADSFIDRYKNKYHQQIGKEFEGGVELSKGQNQRLALARTIYRNGYVVILDEPTAAIDAKSEMEIFENMEKASGESTLILITHRFNTVKSLDNIIVLEHGKIQEMGTHKELIKLNSRYAEMFNAQAKGFLEELKSV